MAIGDIGTIAWARRTGGRLTADERDQIQRSIVELQAWEMAERSETAREAIRHMDLDAVLIPDSTLAKKAGLLVRNMV